MNGLEDEKIEGIEEDINNDQVYINPFKAREYMKLLLSKVKELEIRLGEAQQWIDSEPDWKNQYMKKYKALQDENKELKAMVDAVNKASDERTVTPGFWGRVAARQTILSEVCPSSSEVCPSSSEVCPSSSEVCPSSSEVCLHQKTHNEDWPDGGGIEICDDCGMSRHHWEQGESLWIMVENIPKVRKELEEALRQMNRMITDKK